MIVKYTPFAGLLLGAFIFFLIYGYGIVDPSNINWVMSGDPGQHFLGWHFFRTEPWSLPLGAIQRYYSPAGTSIVFMDSIPLIAIPLKLFSSLLPQTFQYLGLWLLACYMLQGFFASLLISRITPNFILIFLGATFFILSPIMFWRVGGHEALASHWLILASVYLYLLSYSRNTNIKWIFLIVTSALVHFYLLTVVLAIWLGYILSFLWSSGKKSIILTIAYLILTLLLLALVLWMAGYFVVPFGVNQAEGFGYFSMNILAPFNPMGGGQTTFLNKFEMAIEGQFEGYNYLGFGFLLMLIIVSTKFTKFMSNFSISRYGSMLLVFAALYILAISNKITFGNIVIVEYKYPWILNDLGNILRSSGRMFWPLYYTVMLVGISIIIKCYNTKKSISILSIFLIVQIIDFYPWYSNPNVHWRTLKPILNSAVYESTLKSTQWIEITNTVDHLVMIPPSLKSDPNNDFTLYAANNNLDINIGYVARKDKVRRSKYEKQVMERFSDGQLEDRTLYVIGKDNLIMPSDQKKYLFGKLDGYNIIAPAESNLQLESYFDSREVIISGTLNSSR